MPIRVKNKDWRNPAFKEAILKVAELLNEELEVELPKVKFKPYNAQIWMNDDIVEEKDFYNKSDSLKWAKNVLSKKKYNSAYLDLKKYNQKDDDFDWWYYKLLNNKLTEFQNMEEI